VRRAGAEGHALCRRKVCPVSRGGWEGRRAEQLDHLVELQVHGVRAVDSDDDVTGKDGDTALDMRLQVRYHGPPVGLPKSKAEPLTTRALLVV